MNLVKIVASIALLSVSIFSQNTLKGTVVSAKGDAIVGAEVSLITNGTSTTTDNDGAFTLTTASTATIRNQVTTVSSISLTKRNLNITVDKTTKIELTLFTTSGRAISKISKSLSVGSHSLQFIKDINIGNGVYILKGVIGNQKFLARIIPEKTNIIIEATQKQLAKQKKRADNVDSLKITKTGFNDTTLSINSYSDSLSPITLIAKPIFEIKEKVVIDTEKGLMWQNVNIWHGERAAAITHCEDLDLDGYNDWRLATEAELGRFHKLMNAQGDVPNQAFDHCTAEVTTDGYVKTKKGADTYGGEPGDHINFSGGANVRGVRTVE